MNDSQRNQTIAAYSAEHLSPTLKQRGQVSASYEELCQFLDSACFMSGSYARFTAVRPPKDLDVIWVCNDAAITTDSRRVLQALADSLERAYREHSTNRVRVEIQDHSITVLFLDDADGFSIDVVPAVEQRLKNEFGDPIYSVPETQKLSHRQRRAFSGTATWILSDPRGYISEATNLESASDGRFRRTAKIVKAWRQKQKAIHEDAFKLKSFHLEQLVAAYFKDRGSDSILDGLLAVIGSLNTAIETPRIRDRADGNVFIDQYVEELSSAERAKILSLQGEAFEILSAIASTRDGQEINELLDQLTKRDRRPAYVAPAVIISEPPQPYGGLS